MTAFNSAQISLRCETSSTKTSSHLGASVGVTGNATKLLASTSFTPTTSFTTITNFGDLKRLAAIGLGKRGSLHQRPGGTATATRSPSQRPA